MDNTKHIKDSATVFTGHKTFTDGIKSTVFAMKTADYVILDDDNYSHIFMSATSSVSVTLPTAEDNTGREIVITNLLTSTVAVIPEGAEEINGTVKWEITEQHGRLKVISDGTRWIVTDQWGSIYETILTTTTANLTTNWVDYYSLSGLTSGVYIIEYAVHLFPTVAANVIFATLATAVDTEDSEDYTLRFAANAGTAGP